MIVNEAQLELVARVTALMVADPHLNVPETLAAVRAGGVGPMATKIALLGRMSEREAMTHVRAIQQLLRVVDESSDEGRLV